jgi:hypothetical protein
MNTGCVSSRRLHVDSLRNKKLAPNYDEIITGDMALYNWTTTLDFPDQLLNQGETIHIGMIFTNIKSRLH